MLITILYLSLILQSGLTIVVLQSGDQVSRPGLTVKLDCSLGPGFSMGSQTMYWYRQHHYGAPVEFLTKEYDQTAGRFQSNINSNKNSFPLNISELNVNDSSTYYCAASHSDAHAPGKHTNTERDDRRRYAGRKDPWLGLSIVTNMLITILYLSLILQSGLTIVVLQSGDQVSRPGLTVKLDCSPDTRFSIASQTMYWYRQHHYGAPVEFLTKEYDQSVGRFQSNINSNENSFPLNISELNVNDSSTYYCVASHSDAHAPGTKLTVLEYDVEEPKVEVFGPSSNECHNLKNDERKKTLLCVASDFYPDHISVSWEVDGETVTTGVATDSFAAQDGKYYRISSRLRVDAEDWYNAEQKKYECIVTFFNGTNYNIHTAYIYGEEAPKDFHIREKYLRATQTAKLSYAVFIIKSSIYGAFVAFLVWKLKGSSGKQNG
ncbi:immunoglobulin lambda-1 light chain-like [Solea senegalensis]|nr:immunoglobulin lambda-1 light chain-like [Solea senegalensis]